MSDDFCIEHGYDFIRRRLGDPIPHCEACETVAEVANLEKDAIEALRTWFKFQSSENTATLYNAAVNLFGSDFDPREYDDVE